MELKKIAIAIFLGIFVGAMVTLALTVTPLLRWLLGVLVGSSVGLLWYDLKEVREKAPLAWEKAKKGSRYSLDWLWKPHPFFYPFLVITGILFFSILKPLWVFYPEEMPFGIKIFVTVLALCLICSINVLVFVSIVSGLVLMGAHKKRCYWEPSIYVFLGQEKKIENYKKISMTYRNIYGLILTGLGCAGLAVLTAMPGILKGIGIRVWMVLWFVFYGMWALLLRFVWYLFKLISSHERILCAIYCAAGVTAIHILFGHQVLLLGQKIIIAVSGGIIGAAVGVIHYWLVQLFLTPATNNT